jgi:hypothetical protein
MDSTDVTWPQAFPKRKIIRHKWDDISPTFKLKHKICRNCLCEKFFSPGFGRLVYMTRLGNIFYRTPCCVLPNTKL